jgi:hypothetical protein
MPQTCAREKLDLPRIPPDEIGEAALTHGSVLAKSGALQQAAAAPTMTHGQSRPLS